MRGVNPAATAIMIASLVCLAGCSHDSLIVIEVTSDLVIPTEADSLSLTVLNEESKELLNLEVDLLQGQLFPIEFLLEPSKSTPRNLELRVEALLSGAPVAAIHVRHKWKRNALNRATLPQLRRLP